MEFLLISDLFPFPSAKWLWSTLQAFHVQAFCSITELNYHYINFAEKSNMRQFNVHPCSKWYQTHWNKIIDLIDISGVKKFKEACFELKSFAQRGDHIFDRIWLKVQLHLTWQIEYYCDAGLQLLILSFVLELRHEFKGRILLFALFINLLK